MSERLKISVLRCRQLSATGRLYDAMPCSTTPTGRAADGSPSEMSEHHVQGSRHVGEIERLDEQARVPDLPPAPAAHEAPKLLLERALSPRRLPLEGSEGSEVALRVDHVLDRGRPERSDQLVLQVRDAHEEADAFHGGACEVGAEVGALETSPELTLFPDVAETR